MKLELESKVKTLVDGYIKNGDARRTDIRKILETYKSPAVVSKYSTSYIKDAVKADMDAVMKDWKQYNTKANQSLKDDVAAAKKSVLDVLGLKSDKADATAIANARAFLKDELDDIGTGQLLNEDEAAALDDTMHLILKDFVADYDTMTLFHKMVERKTPTADGWTGVPVFPKTFGKFFKCRNAMEALNTIEADAELLFIHEMKDSDEVIRFNGLVYSVPIDGYAEKAAEQTVIDNAAFLDDFADHIDSEGQDTVPGGSVTKL